MLDFTVTNPNDQAIGLDSLGIPGGTGFSRAGGTCEDQLEAQDLCTVSVAFSPSRIGPASTELAITSGTHTTTAELTGTAFVSLTVNLTGGGGRMVTAKGTQPDTTCQGTDDPKQCAMRVFTEGLELEATIAARESTEDPEYSFSGWSGACDGDNPCTPSLDQPGTVTATFGPVTDPNPDVD
ncbi:hypothetical protein AB0H18_19350 [Streptomyces sp. NPDC020766]|uniref:hypothetical protein n=1 Tax=Streptomyces sp. NPDC020766 TaxID=3155011 RepID=UPI0034099E0E